MTLGQLFKTRREALGLSMKDAAKAIGVHENTYRFYERNAQKPAGQRILTSQEWLELDAGTMLQLLADTRTLPQSAPHQPKRKAA